MPDPLQRLPQRPVPAYWLIVFFLLGICLYYCYDHCPLFPGTSAPPPKQSVFVRQTGYQFIRPFLYVDRLNPSPAFEPLQQTLQTQISQLLESGKITDASVYLRNLERGDWMGINEKNYYHPGSLLKVPIMMAALCKLNGDSTYLDKKLRLQLPKDVPFPVQNYLSKKMEEGKSYTIREVLEYMICYSDNQAVWLLQQELGQPLIDKVYTDLGIGLPPKGEDGRVRSCAKDFSKVLVTLFNAAYLGPKASEFAMSLLAKSDFDKGLASVVPASGNLAHKFGEWDNQEVFELHESGIFFVGDKPYLITIMTKGNQREMLPEAISQLAGTMYRDLTTITAP